MRSIVEQIPNNFKSRLLRGNPPLAMTGYESFVSLVVTWPPAVIFGGPPAVKYGGTVYVRSFVVIFFNVRTFTRFNV